MTKFVKFSSNGVPGTFMIASWSVPFFLKCCSKGAWNLAIWFRNSHTWKSGSNHQVRQDFKEKIKLQPTWKCKVTKNQTKYPYVNGGVLDLWGHLKASILPPEISFLAFDLHISTKCTTGQELLEWLPQLFQDLNKTGPFIQFLGSVPGIILLNCPPF